ncbi:hypothetical protein P7K49_009024 [Saguinus oedipus]|uniref:Uncharacterized protein n=1 Tax=Saguinus oedipus TaxID=9490 RepID=A0ABQ9W1U5_SAGOE|nr:hypothetical protein P7K49_009024 [Saguinus oedipus]
MTPAFPQHGFSDFRILSESTDVPDSEAKSDLLLGKLSPLKPPLTSTHCQREDRRGKFRADLISATEGTRTDRHNSTHGTSSISSVTASPLAKLERNCQTSPIQPSREEVFSLPAQMHLSTSHLGLWPGSS